MPETPFKPVILTLVEGLGLNFWEAELPKLSLEAPVLYLLNSEAEEAAAALTLLKTKYKEVLVTKTGVRKSRGSALVLGLEKAKDLGFTHALTVQDLLQNKEAIETLLANGKENPHALFLKQDSDSRRLYPLYETLSAIDENHLGLAFESEILKYFYKNRIYLPIPGKPEKTSYAETLYASLLRLIKS